MYRLALGTFSGTSLPCGLPRLLCPDFHRCHASIDGEQHAVDLLLGSCAQHLAREIQLDLVAIVAIDVRKGEEEGSVKGVAVV